MKILAVDTALGACSVALLSGRDILAHRYEEMARGHAEALAPMVEQVVMAASIPFAALDRLAVSVGPGTFTGQRVGLAFMRGLRIALKRPLIGITTLEAMCAAARAQTGLPLAAAIHDAKRGEVYLAVASNSDMMLPPRLVALEDAPSEIIDVLAPDTRIALAGTGAKDAARRLGAHAELTTINQPDALWIARLAANRPEPTAPPTPLYLRAPDAKLPAAAT